MTIEGHIIAEVEAERDLNSLPFRNRERIRNLIREEFEDQGIVPTAEGLSVIIGYEMFPKDIEKVLESFQAEGYLTEVQKYSKRRRMTEAGRRFFRIA